MVKVSIGVASLTTISGQLTRDARAQEEVVEPESGIAPVGVPEIVPEGVDSFAGMKLPQCVCPPLVNELGIRFLTSSVQRSGL